MRIGVVSDSHRNLYMLDKAIGQMGQIDMLIHLGDDYKDVIKINEKYKLPIHYVIGNNDYSSEPLYDKVIESNGKRIFLTHGHKYDVHFGIDRLYFKAMEVDADIVLYGHTHRQSAFRHGDVLYLNPGSVAFPRDSKPSCAVIDINPSGDVDVRTIRFEV